MQKKETNDTSDCVKHLRNNEHHKQREISVTYWEKYLQNTEHRND